MRIVSLASGSKGNAYLVSSHGRTLVVDCGLSFREFARRVALAGCDLSAIAGVLVTHDHTDHTAGLAAFRSHFPEVPIYANLMTAEAAAANCPGLGPDDFTVFEDNQVFSLDAFDIEPFPVPHDVPDAVGYMIYSDGFTYFHATDFGVPLESIGRRLGEADAATLESNHDVPLLRASGRPLRLIRRIEGPRGHLSNCQCAELVEKFAGPKLKHLALAHLSQDCNAPHLAEAEVREALERIGRTEVEVSILAQDCPRKVCDAGF